MGARSNDPTGFAGGSLQRRAEVLRKRDQAKAELERGEREGPTETEPEDDSENRSGGPAGTGEYLVKSGECVSSIAKDTGHFWATIWNDPANAEVREVRKEPNVLLAGDHLHVPPLRPKEEPGETEMRHRFMRRGEPASIRVRVMDDGEPRAGQPYTVEVGGRTFSGVVDAGGWVMAPIPPGARKGVLTIGPDNAKIPLLLGDLDPISEMSGVQARLKNLGFDCGGERGNPGELTCAALRAFQEKHDLPVTGEADDATRAKLVEQHGS